MTMVESVVFCLLCAAPKIIENVKRSKIMKANEIEIDENFMSAVYKIESEKPSELTKAEVNELTERFKGMSQAEMELFIDIVPVELCLNRIQKELKKAKEFEKSIKSVMAKMV